MTFLHWNNAFCPSRELGFPSSTSQQRAWHAKKFRALYPVHLADQASYGALPTVSMAFEKGSSNEFCPSRLRTTYASPLYHLGRNCRAIRIPRQAVPGTTYVPPSYQETRAAGAGVLLEPRTWLLLPLLLLPLLSLPCCCCCCSCCGAAAPADGMMDVGRYSWPAFLLNVTHM